MMKPLTNRHKTKQVYQQPNTLLRKGDIFHHIFNKLGLLVHSVSCSVRNSRQTTSGFPILPLPQGQKKDGEWHEFESLCVTRDVLNSENSNFVMAKLMGDTCYRIELRAHNAIGFSQPASVLIRTALGESDASNELGTFTYDLASLYAGRNGAGNMNGNGHDNVLVRAIVLLAMACCVGRWAAH